MKHKKRATLYTCWLLATCANFKRFLVSLKKNVMDKPLYSTDWLPGDEADMSSLGSAMGRRVSVDTVATELWLRPGTSDAVKQ